MPDPTGAWMTASHGDAPGALPLIGHLLRLVRDPLRFVCSLPHCADLVQVRVGPWKMIAVCDPGLTRQLLVDDRTFDHGGPFMNRSRQLLGNGLATCPHADHRQQRRLIQPAFHRTREAGYARVMSQQAAELIGSWHDGQMIDVFPALQRFTARTTLTALFGRTLPPSTLRGMMGDLAMIASGLFRQMLTPPPLDRLPTPANRRYERARTSLRRTVAQLVADRRRTGIDHDDLLSILMGIKGQNRGGSPAPSDADIADQVLTFYFAAVDTPATVLSWSLHLLAQHPHIRQALCAEVDTALHGRVAAYEDLPNLPLTRRIITETLRLYPPGWLLTRVTTTDTGLGGIPIPAGTTVLFSAYLIHRRADLYCDPDRFDPDRWLENPRTQLPRGAFIPFGSGPRKCVGEDFSWIETTLTLASITAHWTLAHLQGSSVRPAPRGMLYPENLHMCLTRRQGVR
ncbi:cytochrome P450 [Streptomyces sp. NPDC001700]